MIPKIIHTIAPCNSKSWHPIWHTCYNSWFSCFNKNDFSFQMWDDEESIDNLVKNFYPQYFNLYSQFPHKIMRIDLAKLLILHAYGGVYHDMDFFCYKYFFNEIEKDNKNFYIVQSCEFSIIGESIQNSLIVSSKHNDVLLLAVEEILSKFKVFTSHKNFKKLENSPDPLVNYVTGGVSIQNILSLYLEHELYLHILPRDVFNPLIINYDKDLYTKHAITSTWINKIPTEKKNKIANLIDNNLFDFYKNYPVSMLHS